MIISVIIPTYNRAALTVETLESVLAQTRPPDEIVVIDDGSTDNTREMMASYGDTIHYVYTDNSGMAAARLTAYKLAVGDTLLFLDSDDLLLPEALEVLARELERSPGAPLAFCRAQLIDAQGSVVSPLWEVQDQACDMWELLIQGNCIRSPGAVLLRRSALDAVGGWDAEINANEDWDLWLRMAEPGIPFGFVEEPLFQYRVHASNYSSNQEVMRSSGLRVLEKQIQRQERNPARHAIASRHYAISLGVPTTEEPSSEIHLAHLPPAPSPLAPQHFFLRRLIESTGIAGLYRKVPEDYRRRFRVVFGIDPRV